MSCEMDNASPEVLESMEVAANIHGGLTRYMIAPDGGQANDDARGRVHAADPPTHPPSLSGGQAESLSPVILTMLSRYPNVPLSSSNVWSD